MLRELLLIQLDEAFDHQSWHGPNLRGSLRGVTLAEAVWRPARGRHCIAEQALHAAYWKYVVRRRLRGEPRGSFPMSGSNWIPLPQPFARREWQRVLELLEEQHAALRDTVVQLPPAALTASAPRGTVTPGKLVRGIILHDIYHAGQIQLLKRLQRGGNA